MFKNIKSQVQNKKEQISEKKLMLDLLICIVQTIAKTYKAQSTYSLTRKT